MHPLPAHTKKTVQRLKVEYVEYYADVPIQKYAAMAIGRDEDTIMRWRKSDRRFADAVQRAKAEWVRKRVIATKAEFALERLEKEVFASTKQALHVTVYDQMVASYSERDPNSVDNREVVAQTLDLLMDLTKKKHVTDE